MNPIEQILYDALIDIQTSKSTRNEKVSRLIAAIALSKAEQLLINNAVQLEHNLLCHSDGSQCKDGCGGY